MAKKPKLITCKHCGHEIASSAKACPHCGGKNKKPIFKRIWFWILVVIILLAVIGFVGGGGSSTDNKKIGEVGKDQSTEEKRDSDDTIKIDSTEKSEEENIQTVYKVGDILHDGNMDIVYVSSGDYEDGSEYWEPKEGNKYIFLNFVFINTSDNSDASVSLYDFECYADGYNCEGYYGADDDLSATLSAGRSTQGSIYFEVPIDAKEIEIEYESNVFTDEKITFAFEGDKDSGYVLEKNTEATEGALSVGDVAESKSLNITYLDCFKDESDNMFIYPKDGYHYVTCEFEFENVSDSDISVTYFSFDCYADGIDCEAVYFRDDSISADLSSGRKAKGTVTFEVPDDASVVEVEYLTNYWTSNRVVFDASGC